MYLVIKPGSILYKALEGVIPPFHVQLSKDLEIFWRQWMADHDAIQYRKPFVIQESSAPCLNCGRKILVDKGELSFIATHFAFCDWCVFGGSLGYSMCRYCFINYMPCPGMLKMATMYNPKRIKPWEWQPLSIWWSEVRSLIYPGILDTSFNNRTFCADDFRDYWLEKRPPSYVSDLINTSEVRRLKKRFQDHFDTNPIFANEPRREIVNETLVAILKAPGWRTQ